MISIAFVTFPIDLISIVNEYEEHVELNRFAAIGDESGKGFF